MPTFTPYSDVNVILSELIARVERILSDQLVGIYLFGSLTYGAFDEDSDIDVLFVTADKVDENLFAQLHDMHTELAKLDSVWAVQLEISYIPRAALRAYDPANATHPRLDRGSSEALHWMFHASDWVVQRHLMRKSGMTIRGAPLDTLIDPVTPDDLRRAMVDLIDIWISRIPDQPGLLNQAGYQSYTVLTLCRVLYTLELGDAVSKQEAAAWAQSALDPRWSPLIDRAWIGRHNPDTDSDLHDRAETIAFIRYTQNRAAQVGVR